jgi:hypothetical protein
MAEDKLAEIRRMTKELVGDEATEWDVNYAKLLGIADALMGEGNKKRGGNSVMAKKLCSYYMRNAGYPYKVIARTIGVTNHATPLHHFQDCVDFLGDVFGDKDYKMAHRKAQELGIAV